MVYGREDCLIVLRDGCYQLVDYWIIFEEWLQVAQEDEGDRDEGNTNLQSTVQKQ